MSPLDLDRRNILICHGWLESQNPNIAHYIKFSAVIFTKKSINWNRFTLSGGLSGSMDILGKKRASYYLQYKTTRWAMSNESVDLAFRSANSPRPVQNCGLHPLIHTLLILNVAQVMGFCQREEKKPPLDRSS